VAADRTQVQANSEAALPPIIPIFCDCVNADLTPIRGSTTNKKKVAKCNQPTLKQNKLLTQQVKKKQRYNI